MSHSCASFSSIVCRLRDLRLARKSSRLLGIQSLRGDVDPADDESANQIGMPDCEHEPEDAAVAESDDIDMPELELVQQRDGILHHPRVAQRPRHIGRSALSDLVRRDDAMLLGQEIELALERVLSGIAPPCNSTSVGPLPCTA